MEPDWDRRYREGFYGGAHDAHPLVKKYAPLMARDRPVIDVAMGLGLDLLFLARAGFPACGLERSREAICLARQTIDKDEFDIWYVLGDACALPFKPGSVGTVLVFYFLRKGHNGRLGLGGVWRPYRL